MTLMIISHQDSVYSTWSRHFILLNSRQQFSAQFKQGMYLSIDGIIKEQNEASIDCQDRGYLLGDGLFETMRVNNGHICHWDKHWHRLYNSAATIDLALPFSQQSLLLSAQRLLRANDLSEAGLRLTLSRSAGPRGLLPFGDEKTHWQMHCFPLSKPRSIPLVLHISSIRRNESSPLSRIKSINYLDNILAKKEALMMGADDALLLNSRGQITSSTCANFFLYKEDQWFTPPIFDGVLPGIMRQTLIERLRDCRETVHIMSLTPEMINQQCSALLCNSLIGTIAVKQINDVQLSQLQSSALVSIEDRQ